MMDLTSEDRLLLLLAQGALSVDGQEQARALLRAPLEWEKFLERVVMHEVYPLVYRNLDRLGFPDVPPHLRVELAARTKINAFRNIHLAEELARVLGLFADMHIPAIPLKGVSLAAFLYGDPTLRVCVDMDILVPRRHVLPALRLLREQGYATEWTEQFFADLLLRSAIECALVREDIGCSYILELHWGILWSAAFHQNDMEELWTDAQPTVWRGTQAYTLSLEWQFLFLSAHAARHRWQGLKWLVDIHTLCSREALDWQRVWSTARRLGWEEMIRVTLSASHALFGTKVELRDAEKVLPSWVRLFPHDATPSLWEGLFAVLSLLPRPTEKLRFVCHALFTPTLAERRFVRLPPMLGFVYYLLRPMRLGCKWSVGLVSKCFPRLQ